MPRHKEFDPDRAVDAAMRVFWSKGYEGTSAQDLCEGTGLGRSSIYNAFDGKRDLYERALRRYDEQMTTAQVEMVDRPGPVRDRVREMLEATVESELCEDGPRGCFAVNAAMEFGGRDAAVTAIVDRGFDRLRHVLHVAIGNAQACGEVDAGKDAAALADFIQSSVGGLRVLARTVRDRDRLMRVVDVIVTAM